MNTYTVELNLDFLKNVEVTGKDTPPALESVSYGTEHLGFLGKDKAKLTGKVEVVINLENGSVVPLTGDIPSTQLEVTTPGGSFFVLPHRIQLSILRPMTVEEVYAHIDAQIQWTDEEKRAIQGLYQGYVNTAGAPKTSPLSRYAEQHREQLKGYGIIV